MVLDVHDILMLLLILLAPILFNATGLIDTYLTQRFKNQESDGVLADGIATLMIIGGIVALAVALVIVPFYGIRLFEISSQDIFYLLLCGIVYGFAAFPYFKALNSERIENIIPVLQTIPLFTYLFAVWLLGEVLSATHVLIIVAVVLTTMLFGRDYHSKTMNRKGVYLTVLSSVLYAISYVFFKLGGGETTQIRVAFFWEHLGVAIACLLFAIKPRVRSTTVIYFKTNGRKFSFLNLTNEFFYIIGIMIVNFLSLRYPVAIVSTLSNGLQPILGFIMTYLASRSLPSLFDRSYTKQDMVLKMLLCVVACLLLGWFFSITN